MSGGWVSKTGLGRVKMGGTGIIISNPYESEPARCYDTVGSITMIKICHTLQKRDKDTSTLTHISYHTKPQIMLVQNYNKIIIYELK